MRQSALGYFIVGLTLGIVAVGLCIYFTEGGSWPVQW
jgi:hypothetical protein